MYCLRCDEHLTVLSSILDEWKNFLERMGCENWEDNVIDETEELRNWASFRGQTLSRTGEGNTHQLLI